MRKQNTKTFRWDLPAMEHAKINTLYSFSYNPESQPCSYASDRIQKWYSEMVKVISSLKACNVVLNLEISKLGRLHFHGTIQISSLWKFYYYDVPKLMVEGSFEIDTIKSIEDWQAYVDKNKDEMSKMCEAFGLCRTLATNKIKIQKPDKEEVSRFNFKNIMDMDKSETESESDTESTE